MVPLADLANHRLGPAISPFRTLPDGSVSFHATQDLKPRQEVSYSYGTTGPIQQLATFGFLDTLGSVGSFSFLPRSEITSVQSVHHA